MRCVWSDSGMQAGHRLPGAYLSLCVAGGTLTSIQHYGMSPGHSGASSQRNERNGRKERNEMTSLLDSPFTATSDDGTLPSYGRHTP